MSRGRLVWGGRCGYRRGVHLGRRAGLHGGRNCGSVCWRCLRSRGRRNCSALGNSGSAMIHTNQIRVNIADLAVLGLDAGEDKAVDQDGEALSARYGAEGVWSLPRLTEDLRALRMARAVDVPQVVCPSGGGQEKTACQQNRQPYASHYPLLGPGTRRALNSF